MTINRNLFLTLSFCWLATSACGGEQQKVGAAKSMLKLYASESKAKASCGEVKTVTDNAQTFFYCATPSETCRKRSKACPAIYTEGADPDAHCFEVCEDQLVNENECSESGTVSVAVNEDGSVSDETFTPAPIDACVPDETPGASAPGCPDPSVDPSCETQPPPDAGDCTQAHVPGVCGAGEAKASCCGVEIPA